MKYTESERQYFNKILKFFAEIGIKYQLQSFEGDSFLPGVKIRAGELIIDETKLAHPGDLLHEAGHLAVEPAGTRQALNDNVRESGQQEGLETAAIAWSWAALTYLQLPPEFVLHEAGYKGASQNLIEAFQNDGILGQPLLSYFQMCGQPGEENAFPAMSCWLRK